MTRVRRSARRAFARVARRGAAAALVPVVLLGCAGRVPAPAPAAAAPGPVPAAQPPTPAAARPTASTGPRRFVPADSLPTADALAVLATIPEPLNGAASNEPPARTSGGTASPPAVAPPPPNPSPVPIAAPPETSRVARPPVVPIALAPAPSAPRDTVVRATAPGASDRAPVLIPPPPSPPPPPPPPPDTCWRVQFAAPAERVRAEALRDAAQSLLVTPVVIELEASRWKVRTRDCLARAAAESLRKRALDSGLAGAFLVRSTPS